MTTHLELATFGGGCFWCLEAVFVKLRGVDQVVSGYMGGHTPNPDYDQVCSGRSGHAEVVQIHYDPAAINYETLLQIFFSIHDPTTLNRQGNDVGSQYRSVIFYHTPQQREAAIVTLAEQSATWLSPVVTELQPAETFYPAEHYHQRYFELNPNQPYCAIVVEPKVRKAQHLFSELLR
ncbi:MAG: peptide-methionine (S)-S-oxide reductase MsrA [Chitinivorax sp.]